MKKWIFNSKLSYYDVLGEFVENGFIDWGSNLKEIEIGDWVYLYMGAPISKILVKAQIEGIRENEEYGTCENENDSGIKMKKKWATLTIEECFIGKKMHYLTYDKLIENGLKGTIRSQMSLSNNVELNDYIEMIEV